MQAYDCVMLIVLGLAIVWGAWKGLAWQLASIASIAVSYFVALHFRQPLAAVIDASPPWNVFSAMLILFLGTGLIVWVAFNLVSEFIERVKLKEFDRQLGAVFGACKGVLLCVLITLFSVALLGDSQRQAICNSRSGYYIAVLLDRADMMIPRELHQVLAPYLEKLDETVEHPHTAGSLGPAPGAATSGGQPGWQQELEAVFSGRSKTGAPAVPLPAPSFPTGGFQPRPEPPPVPQTAGRIEAQPAQPASANSFRRW